MSRVYQSPFAERYSSKEMLYTFSHDRRFRVWRELWIVLAEAERKLGLPISAAQIRELKSTADRIDYAAVRRYEERLKHDVMAHIRAWGDRCPKARGIIHLGATSCYVTDNTDLMLFRESL